MNGCEPYIAGRNAYVSVVDVLGIFLLVVARTGKVYSVVQTQVIYLLLELLSHFAVADKHQVAPRTVFVEHRHGVYEPVKFFTFCKPPEKNYHRVSVAEYFTVNGRRSYAVA